MVSVALYSRPSIDDGYPFLFHPTWKKGPFTEPSDQVRPIRDHQYRLPLINPSIHQKSPVVEVGVQTGETGQVFFVRDKGMGIRTEDQPKIFGLFERLNPDIPGTGIGLATVKRIIEAHGGKICVESEGAGKGTTFWFILPGVPADIA
jgi:light-regulated signal transduction histidine kinase (bacteriophytochrome)